MNIPEHSVHELIGELCQSIGENAATSISASAVKQLRSKSFEVLLKRSSDKHQGPANDHEDHAIKRLNYCLFHQRLKASTFFEKTQCDELEECRDILERTNNLQEASLNVLHLLINLRDSASQFDLKKSQDDYIFGKFFLEYTPNNKHPYPVFTKEMLTLPKIFTFDDKKSKHMVDNPYILSNNPPTFFELTIPEYSRPNLNKRLDTIGSLRLPLKLSFNPSDLKAVDPEDRNTQKRSDNVFVTSQKSLSFTNSPPKVYNSYSWDHLGLSCFQKKKSFISESNEANSNLHLLSVCVENFEAKIVTLDTFLHDLRCLVVGIQSETFVISDLIIFEMIPNVTIENISPDTMAGLLQEFLECGTCFKRLQVMSTKNLNFKLVVDGFVFKALCTCVKKHLEMFRLFVTSFDDKSVSSFYGRMSTLMQQLIVLAKILGIHPDVPMERKLPTGSEFLALIYNEIRRTTQQEMSMFLLYILKECCHIYFKNLQKWIYHGHLEDQSKQMFISFYDCYRVHTKYFFDKAYLVRRDAVPAFIQGFEDSILLCGKYAMLLKEFKPNHPVFSIPLPSISVCLSFEEVEKMEINCNNYLEQAHKVCGTPVTVHMIVAQKAQEREAFYKKVAANLKLNLEKWKQEQEQKQHKLSETRQLQLVELKNQIKENEEVRLAKRMANIAEEKVYLKMEEEIEKKRLQKEHEDRTTQIEYYKELYEIVEKKMENTDKKVKQLRNEIHRAELSKELECTPIHNDEDAVENSKAENNNIPAIEEANNLNSNADQKLTELDLLNSNVSSPSHEHQRNKTKILGSSLSNTYSTSESNQNENIRNVKNNNKVVSNPNTLFTNKSKALSSEQYISTYRDDLLENTVSTNESDDLIFNRLNMHSSSQYKDSNKHVDVNNKATNESVDLMSNRTKMHSSSQYKSSYNDEIPRETTSNMPLTDLQKNRIKVLSCEYNEPKPTVSVLVKDPNAPLSDLQKNRLKVMSSEYEDPIENVTKVIDVNAPLSDLQKNRLKVMSQEYGQPSDEPVKQKLNLDLNTDRARNRRKVMECEFNIVTGEKNTPRKACTPMSTGSDTPNLNIEEDIVNGNITLDKNGQFVALKLNTNLAPIDTLDMPTASSFTNHLTPMSALNTAGISLRNGFVFERKGVISTLNDVVDDIGEDDLRSLFMLRIPTTSKSPSEYETVQNDIQKLNVSTLHQFLQRSIVIPMNAHLEILNNEILRIFLQDLDILSHFQSMRHYFFLMDGEFATNICDGLIRHLEEGAPPSKLLKYQILHPILENSLGSSIIGNDKNAENLSFIVDCMPEQFDLSSPNALGMLSLSYRVKWPLNLILNTETIEQCANIFKYLVKLRRISWLLEDAYQNLKAIGKLLGKDILHSPQYRRVQQIRHKIFHFINALQYHVTSNALQISWKKFEDDLLTVRSMEDLYRKHTVYVKRVLFLCMLNKKSAEFHNTIEDIFKVAIRFCRHLGASDWTTGEDGDDEHKFVHSKFGKILVDERNFEKLIKYTIYLGEKIVRHGYQAEIGEFINLININGYYNNI